MVEIEHKKFLLAFTPNKGKSLFEANSFFPLISGSQSTAVLKTVILMN